MFERPFYQKQLPSRRPHHKIKLSQLFGYIVTVLQAFTRNILVKETLHPLQIPARIRLTHLYKKAMRLKYLLFSTIFLVPFLAHPLLAQRTEQTAETESLESILSAGTDFQATVKRADEYFKQKHPGVSFAELSRGEHRDGKFVKYQRWQDFWKMHLTPDGKRADIPSRTTAAIAQKSSVSFQETEWDNISYENYITGQIGMGRTTSIGFHPTDAATFYVGTANGGVWKTTNGGSSYQALGDGLPFLSVSSVVVNRQNPDHLYIAVSDHVWYGPPGLGVFKSTDGGATWNPTPIAFPFTANVKIYWIEPDPTNPDKMLVATSRGIYMTTDAFASAERVQNINAREVKFSPGSANIAFATSGNGEFFKSTNGGVSWTMIRDFGNSTPRIALTPLDLQKVFITYGDKLYRSTDQGDSFPVSEDLRESNAAQHTAVSPQDDTQLYSGYFELYRSGNEGNNYQKLSDWLGRDGLYLMHVDIRNVFVNPLENDKIYFCHDGGIERLDVTTNTFEAISDGLLITQYYDIATAQSDPQVVSGGSQDNGSMYRNAAGVWDDFAPTGDGMVTEIDPTDATILYWEYQNGGMRRNQNGSNTNISPPGQNGEGAWETPFKLDPSNPSRIIAGYDRVYESNNRGNSWTAISPSLANGADLNQIAISATNPDRIYAARNADLYRREQGANWTSLNTPANGAITDLEVDPTDENTLYISVAGYANSNKVFRSTDGGDSWTNISGALPNVPVGSIELYRDSPGGIFAGTHLGVFYRDNSLPDWVELGALPHTDVRDIEIQYATKKIRIGTHGRGIFEADINVNFCGEATVDTDSDGVCDELDICPDLDDTLIGTPCDDGNPNTIRETYTNDCNCAGGVSALEYCDAAGADGTGGDFISNVRLNTIDNSSGQTGYSDFRGISTSLEPGESYEIAVTLASVFDLDVAYAWIDYNQDEVFDNETELISFGDFVNNVATANFTVPTTTLRGLTVMRVRSVFSDAGPEPCGDIFGEVEDYSIDMGNVAYCAAAGASGTGADWINRVQLGDLDNASEQTSYSDFTDQNANLLIGEDYTMSVGLNAAFGSDSVFAWIDYNADGIFDNDSEQLVFSSITDLTATSNLTVPDTLTDGTTRMRVRVVFADPNPAMPCDTLFGEVEDYTVTFLSDACVIGAACDDGNPFTTGEALNEDCECSGGFTFPSYCSAEGAAGTGGDWINRVQLNTIDNASEQSQYADFTNISTEIIAGSTQTITVGLNGAFEQDSVFAWIDFNRDGTFDNDEEQIVFPIISTIDTVIQVTATFTVPADAVPSITRLRVRVAFDGINNAEPCGSIFGEVEDYAISILAADCTPGAACDDGNPFTGGETFDENCSCNGGQIIESGQFCQAAGATGTGGDWIRRVRLNGIDNVSDQTAYSDFTDISTFLSKDDTYTMSVELNTTFSLDSVFAWIDFNQDTIFDNQTEQIVFSTLTDNIATAQVSVPADAPLGNARMRVRVVFADPNPAEPCGDLFGEVEDYNVEIIAEGCVPGVACDDGNPDSEGSTFDDDCNCTGGVVIREYCQAAGSAGTGADWISLVEIENIFNASEQSAYSDFTDIATDLTLGEEYILQVTANAVFGLDSMFAWIDWNQDTIFDNATELIVFPSFDDNNVTTATVVVPTDAAIGETRLRVRMAFGDPNPARPCGNVFGEVEDYQIYVVPDCTEGAACDDGNPATTDEVFTFTCRCESPTAVNDFSEALRFALFPNPAQNILNVRLQRPDLTGSKLTVTITDILGREVQRHEARTLDFDLDVKALAGSQTYFLTLKDEQGRRFVKRFVKL
jgi:photosystem II stability/assembly factor-like uncharacterized protein